MQRESETTTTESGVWVGLVMQRLTDDWASGILTSPWDTFNDVQTKQELQRPDDRHDLRQFRVCFIFVLS